MAESNPRLSPEQARHLAVHGVRANGDGWSWKYDPLVGLFPAEEFGGDTPAIWREVTTISRAEVETSVRIFATTLRGLPFTAARAMRIRSHPTPPNDAPAATPPATIAPNAPTPAPAISIWRRRRRPNWSP